MSDFIIRRLLFTIFLLFIIGTIVFFMTHFLPGDPALTILGGAEAAPDPESLELVRERLGLNLPLHVQYFNWIKQIVTFDFGISFITNRSISDDILIRLFRTFLLIVPASVLSILTGVFFGIFSAKFQGSIIDPLISGLMLIGFSTPVFVSGTIMVLIFSVHFGFLPSGGFASPFDGFKDYGERAILPIISLSFAFTAIVMRMTRSSILEQMRLDYVRTAFSKGLGEKRVLYKHVLRNALIPVISITGLQMGRLIGGTMLVETIFNWPGLSSFLINALNIRDYPTVQSIMLVIAFFFLLINLVTDLLYGFVDPRISYK